jgi:hypothetical protein
MKCLLVSLVVGLAALLPSRLWAGEAAKSLRVYFVGNSVTDTIKYGPLAELAKARGEKMVWGRHMLPGAPLQWIWEHPKDGFQEQPFGHYPTALANYSWDVLSLQPFDRLLDGKDGDLAMARRFIDLTLPKSPDLQVYVYARWPRQGKDDFDTVWKKKYTGGWDGTNETRDYFERLTLELRKAYPKLKKPVLMVPVGHVMFELNQRMKAGEVPGYTDVKQLFADGIHLNPVGSYVVGCTYFATLFQENPKGLPGGPYQVTDAKLAEAIQETVWKVVSGHELAGVKRAGGSQASMKGWEVYAWQENGQSHFALLVGTNRLKTADEIAKAAVQGFDAFKPQLDQLASGQEVFVSGKQLLQAPPQTEGDQVVGYCKKIGLEAQRHE